MVCTKALPCERDVDRDAPIISKLRREGSGWIYYHARIPLQFSCEQFGESSLIGFLLSGRNYTDLHPSFDAGQNLLAKCQTILTFEKVVILKRLARKLRIHILHHFEVLRIQEGFGDSAIKYL